MVKCFSPYRLQATFPTHNHKRVLDLLSRHQRLLLHHLCLYLTAAHLITSTFLLNCPLNQLRSSNTSFISPPSLIHIDSFRTDLQSSVLSPHNQSSTIPRPSLGCLQFLSLTKSSGRKSKSNPWFTCFQVFCPSRWKHLERNHSALDLSSFKSVCNLYHNLILTTKNSNIPVPYSKNSIILGCLQFLSLTKSGCKSKSNPLNRDETSLDLR